MMAECKKKKSCLNIVSAQNIEEVKNNVATSAASGGWVDGPGSQALSLHNHLTTVLTAT